MVSECHARGFPEVIDSRNARFGFLIAWIG